MELIEECKHRWYVKLDDDIAHAVCRTDTWYIRSLLMSCARCGKTLTCEEWNKEFPQPMDSHVKAYYKMYIERHKHMKKGSKEMNEFLEYYFNTKESTLDLRRIKTTWIQTTKHLDHKKLGLTTAGYKEDEVWIDDWWH